jgi:hypothetical protein
VAWTTPLTGVANATLTAAQWNASVRDNFAETAPAKATTSGRYFASSGTNVIAERIPTIGIISTAEVTAATSYANMTTVGPDATVTMGVSALVATSAILTNDSAGSNSYASYQISGANTVAASDAAGVGQASSGAGRILSASKVRLHTGLVAGSNTFRMMYRVSGGNGTFQNREITVLPF